MYLNLAILAGFAFVFSILAGRLSRTPVSGAMVFVAFGLVLGGHGLGFLDLDVKREELRLLAELTLAMVLFADAANADLAVLKRNFELPQRLLVIGLPLTIVLGFGMGVLVFDTLTLLEIAILATLLAPTDAALGKAVVTNKAVPAEIRESLNVESGLNDGICVPILFVFLALATASGGEGSTFMLSVTLVAEEVGIGAGVGCGLTLVSAWLLRACAQRGWVTEIWRQVTVPALAVACFAAAQACGGSGFIASFLGGMIFGALAKDHRHAFLTSAEGTGVTLSLITWVAFGVAVIGGEIVHLNWNILLYSVLSLTVIRMLPVYLSLTGSGRRPASKLFMGWFGPRGLASVVFAVIVVNAQLPGGHTVAATAACTIVLSVVLHGLSANPLIAALFSKAEPSEESTATGSPAQD